MAEMSLADALFYFHTTKDDDLKLKAIYRMEDLIPDDDEYLATLGSHCLRLWFS